MEIVYIITAVIEVILTSFIVFHLVRLKMLIEDKIKSFEKTFYKTFSKVKIYKKPLNITAEFIRLLKRHNKKIDEIKKLIDLLKKLDKAINIINSIDFKNLRLKKRANMRIFPVIRKILFFV